jgi:hypothetical protein
MDAIDRAGIHAGVSYPDTGLSNDMPWVTSSLDTMPLLIKIQPAKAARL